MICVQFVLLCFDVSKVYLVVSCTVYLVVFCVQFILLCFVLNECVKTKFICYHGYGIKSAVGS